MPAIRSNEQKLVDLCFAIGLTLSETRGTDSDGKKLELHKLSVPEKAEWIAQQLADNGFPTTPCGSSWGVLLSENPGLVD